MRILHSVHSHSRIVNKKMRPKSYFCSCFRHFKKPLNIVCEFIPQVSQLVIELSVGWLHAVINL